MLKRLGPVLRFVLGMATLIMLLGVTAGLWWWLPVTPRLSWQTPYRIWRALLVSLDGRSLLTSHDRGLSLWDLPEGRERAVLAVEQSDTLILSPDGRKVGFSFEGPHRHVRVWNPDRQDQPWDNRSAAWPAGFTPDSRTLIIVGGQRSSIRWDTITGAEEPIEFPEVDGQMPYADSLFPSGRLLRRVVRSPKLTLIQFRDDYGKGPVRSVEVPNNRLFDLISPDGQFFAGAISGSNEVAVGDLDTGREHATLRSDSRAISLWPKDRFSPDGRYLVTSGDSDHSSMPNFRALPSPNLWDIRACPPRVVGQWEAGWIEFSPDSSWLVVKEPVDLLPGKFAIWRPGGSEPQLQLGVLSESPVFAPDGRTIAVLPIQGPAEPGWLEGWLRSLGLSTQPGSLDQRRELEIWDIWQRRLLVAISDGHQFGYSPDGKTLVVLGTDGTVHIWDIPPRRPWYIDYGLPVVFALLVLLGVRMAWRAMRRPEASSAVEGTASRLIS